MEAAQMESDTTRSNVPLAERAYRIRRNALKMAAVQGQGYIAQALDISDVLAVAYSTHCGTGRKIPTGRTAIASACRSGTTPSHSTRC